MERREIAVRGIVQGVGFRPFVYGLARRLALDGFVCNTADGVMIHVEGSPAALDAFQTALVTNPPPLASLDEVAATSVRLRAEPGFHIVSSEISGALDRNVRISPDVATCDGCLSELLDPSNRRHLYPFITCATCGPRLTIVTSAPYDRERTTMARFAMCEDCRREYEDPLDRRFHAETIGCVECGPQLTLRDGEGRDIPGDPIDGVAAAIERGRIAALKGIGGYHLACDATKAAAVALLRSRKHRDEKPFAVMFDSIETIERICAAGADERRLLLSPARPIVILQRLDGAGPDSPVDAVAPGSRSIGAMLPSTPVQHLLLARLRRPLVMTSGNRSHEPIAFDDAEALQRLRGIADVFLVNDRPIHVRCDDGVSRVVDGRELLVRRSRGHAPRPIRLHEPCVPAVLAVGGHLKNTFALGRRYDAFVSHHIGDLDELSAFDAFRREIALYEALFEIAPEVVAYDLHPDYHSTTYALERIAAGGLTGVGVQHHHAHVASCLAEHGRRGPVIGVAFDGSGYGLDGTVWGGEFLVGDARHVERMAHLRQVCLPGGEQAVREPWRVAMAHLLDAGQDAGLVTQRHRTAAPVVERMIARRINAPLTSSAGRLFDAVAAIAGIRDTVSFEGQAAMQLEWLAAESPVSGEYPHDLQEVGDVTIVDTRPLVAAAATDARAGQGAGPIGRRLHRGLAAAIAQVCVRLRERTGIAEVVLTGGVFLNALLTEDCLDLLTREHFQVYRHELVPPNDGGLCLGQLAVAAARLTTNH